MKNLQFLLLFMGCFLANIYHGQAQNHKYYLRANSSDFNPRLEFKRGALQYTGADRSVRHFFDTYSFQVFEKAFPTAQTPSLQRTFYVECAADVALNEFLTKGANFLEYGEDRGTEDPVLVFTPNDYGNTSPVANLGLAVDLHYLDYIDAQMAWDYTYFRDGVKMGISDGKLLVNDPEFIDKTTFVNVVSHNPAHGTGVSAIAAAQGNNGEGITGVCYDCSIVKAGTGYNRLLQLAQHGAKVINASWVNSESGGSFSQTQQDLINEITNLHGAVVVGGAGNLFGDPQNYSIVHYPASYDNVISVGSVGHINDPTCDNITNTNGVLHILGAKDYVGAVLRFFGNTYDCSIPIQDQVFIQHNSTAVFNEHVDLIAPSGGMFRYGPYATGDGILYQGQGGFATSNSTPQVSGTVGLMKSINPCLTFSEVESILKISSKNIDYLPANQIPRFKDLYGSGSLHAGNSTKLTSDLLNPRAIAYLENQSFKRWNFIFNAVSKAVVIQNQSFTEAATLEVNALNEINLEDGTLIEPNSEGYAELEIVPGLSLPHCTRRAKNLAANSDDKVEEAHDFQVRVAPNPSNGNFRVHFDQALHAVTYRIFNARGSQVLEGKTTDARSIQINAPNLEAGVYMLQVISKEGTQSIRFVKQ